MANSTAPSTRTPRTPRTPRASAAAPRSRWRWDVLAMAPVTTLLIVVTLILVGFGLVMVLDASSVTSKLDGQGFLGEFGKECLFAAIGIPGMLFIGKLPLSFWKKSARIIFLLAALGQVLVFMPGLGVEAGGNRNWIKLFGLNLQPSEFIKIAIAIFLGFALPAAVNRYGRGIKVLSPLLAVLVVTFLVLGGGDLGTVIIFVLITAGCLIFAGVDGRNLLYFGGALVLGALAATVAFPSRVSRITSFFSLNCTSDQIQDCWQPLHGLWGMASGGIFGIGFGRSKMKWSWLPAADNDYIFAIIGEELGLIGCVVLLALMVILAFLLIRVIREATDPMIRITTGGILFWFVGQAFINIAVVLNLIPVLGVPIPFVSSGGTALLSSLGAVGVVLSFARHNAKTALSR